MIITCAFCGKKSDKYIGHVNRANKLGVPVFCNRTCAGLSRRKTVEEKKKIKSDYDKKYRKENLEYVKKRAAAYFKKDYAANPKKYKRQRIQQKENHLKHCRKPEYKKYKHEYDVKRQAKKYYGKFWEAAIALHNLRRIVDNRRAKNEQKSINKQQNRKRYANKNLKRKELESCTVGLYQPS